MAKRQLNQHQREAIDEISDYLSSIESTKSDKFAYWLKDYTRFLRNEQRNHQRHKYKRGDIVQVHLGHNVGAEFGGLHYCIVIEKNNSSNSPIITVIPMRSVKPKDDINNLHPHNIFLSSEFYLLFKLKKNTLMNNAIEKMNMLNTFKDNANHFDSPCTNPNNNYDALMKKIDELEKAVAHLEKMDKNMRKMSGGSIALINQIRAVSKHRIYDPKNNKGLLHGIRLSNETMDKIDDVIKKLFTK